MGPFLNSESAYNSGGAADKPGGYITPEKLKMVMDKLWNREAINQIPPHWDEIGNAEEVGWGEE